MKVELLDDEDEKGDIAAKSGVADKGALPLAALKNAFADKIGDGAAGRAAPAVEQRQRAVHERADAERENDRADADGAAEYPSREKNG